MSYPIIPCVAPIAMTNPSERLNGLEALAKTVLSGIQQQSAAIIDLQTSITRLQEKIRSLSAQIKKGK
jgi:uncharacterized coiled-coil protein SlyX